VVKIRETSGEGEGRLGVEIVMPPYMANFIDVFPHSVHVVIIQIPGAIIRAHRSSVKVIRFPFKGIPKFVKLAHVE
jgi:hypothetical protein